MEGRTEMAARSRVTERETFLEIWEGVEGRGG